MVIDQRNAGASVTITSASSSQYVLDRFYLRSETTGGSKVSVQRSTDAPAGFTNSMLLTSLSAYSLTASQHCGASQAIEGFNFADLGWGTAEAKPVTISFWVRSSLTGTFGGHLSNIGGARSYIFSYTINAANTWEQKTITIDGDTSGTWLTNNSVGLYVSFVVGAGSDTTTAAGSWSSTFYRSVTGQTNLLGTSGATFYITGVQLEKGSQATSFEYRQYQQELALCQRYYYRLTALGATTRFANGYMASTTSGRAMVDFPVPMRAAVTSLETSGTGSDYGIFYLATNTACNAVPTFLNGSDVTTTVTMGTATTLTAGHGVLLSANSINAFLGFSAEL
jgi:hypothetical protein